MLRGRYIAVVLGLWLCVAEAHAFEQPGAEDPLAELARRIQAVESEPGAQATAGRALNQARLALSKARALYSAGQPDAARRATAIGLAAVSLASRQNARERELAELRAAARRAASAQVEAALAHDALQTVRARRAGPSSEVSR